MSIRIVAVLAVVAGCCLAPSNANAGLFNRGGCCDAAPSCCEPVVCCEPVSCCDPCGRQGLFAKIKARRAAKACCAPSCCEPVCCEPAPVCCEPAPVCCEPAPVCCEPAPCCGCDTCGCDSCGCNSCCKKPGLFAKLKARRAARKCCAPTCCEVVSSCGCSTGCGCGM